MKLAKRNSISALVIVLSLVGVYAATKVSKVYTIENSVNEFKMEGIKKTSVGYQYWFADKDFVDGRTLKMSVVAPHQATHAPHTHDNDEFFFVLEGKAKFHLNGKEEVVEPYTSLYCPPDSYHGISNAGDTELKYLVIKKYLKKD
jgi:mannose-6-phosphate isomerase-like protein (cupin superfamily)